MTGTNLQGTNIISMIVPTNHADTYATHDSFYGKGGWREVNTLNERDAIPQERRRQGMVVFVKETYKAYILKNSIYNGGWVPFPATEDISEIVNEAIASGKIEIDLTAYATKAEVSEELANIYKKEEVDNSLSSLEADIKEWVEDQGYLTQHQSLADYVTKDELMGALTPYVLESTLEQELTNYVKTEVLTDTLAEYAKTADIAEIYATKVVIDEKLALVDERINRANEDILGLQNAGYVTEDVLNQKGYINEDNAKEIIDGYGYVTEGTLNTTLGEYTTNDKLEKTLEDYTTKTALEEVLTTGKYVTITDLQGYATELWVKNYITDGKYITVADLQGYATELWVQTYVSNLIKPGGGLDLSAYQLKEDDTLQTEDKTIVGAINEINATKGADKTVIEAMETKIETLENQVATLQQQITNIMNTIQSPQYLIIGEDDTQN